MAVNRNDPKMTQMLELSDKDFKANLVVVNKLGSNKYQTRTLKQTW